MTDDKMRLARKTWYGLISTFFTVGCYGKMPGTMGTLAAAAILMAFGGINISVTLAVIVLGTVAADKYAKESGREDPGEVVIDEVAGYWISMYGLDPSFGIVAFFLFRVVDILKPFPVRTMERLPGGVGIMADDICGGVMTNLILRLLHWLFFENGVTIIYDYLGMGG